MLSGKRVLVVEDGPTITHGEMMFGAGVIAAEKYGALSMVDPRPFAAGSIKETFEKYPHIGKVLPAMGYGDEQVHDLEATINAADCDVVAFATPVDLTKIVSIKKPTVRVRYGYGDAGEPTLESIISRKFQ
jgi:predicted GTPase